jgi:hypothetical protein
VRRDFRRHEANGALQARDGIAGSTECQQARPREQVRRTEGRIEGCRRAEFDERIALTAALLQDDPEIVMDEGAIAASSEDVTERRLGAIQLVRLEGVHTFSEAVRQLWREILCCRDGSDEKKNKESRGCAENGHGNGS